MLHTIHRTTTSIEPDTERILRSLPLWFSCEVEGIRATQTTTFGAII